MKHFKFCESYNYLVSKFICSYCKFVKYAHEQNKIYRAFLTFRSLNFKTGQKVNSRGTAR